MGSSVSALCSGLAQVNDGCAPSTQLRMIESEGDDFRMTGKDGVDGATQRADALAMDDARLIDPFFLAGRQVIRHEVFDFARFECVQIQHAIDRKLDRFIHEYRLGGEGWAVNLGRSSLRRKGAPASEPAFTNSVSDACRTGGQRSNSKGTTLVPDAKLPVMGVNHLMNGSQRTSGMYSPKTTSFCL